MNRNKNEQYQLPNLQWFNYIYSQQEMSLMGLPQTFCCCFSLRIWCGSYLPSLLLFLAALVPNTATYWQHPAVFPLLRLGVACCSTYSCAYMLMDTTLQSSLKVLICFGFGLFFFHVEAKTKKVKRKKNRGGGALESAVFTDLINTIKWLFMKNCLQISSKDQREQKRDWVSPWKSGGCDWSIPQRWRSAELHVAVEVTRSFNPPGGESPPVTLGFLINIPLKCFEY